MPKYLLDSNILSYLDDEKSPFYAKVHKKLQATADEDEVSISVLSLYEYEYSIACATPDVAQELLILRDQLLSWFRVIPLNKRGTANYGSLKHQYRQYIQQNNRSKKEIKAQLKEDSVDLLIASTALAIGAVVVSHDGLFKTLAELVEGFQFEDWTI